MSNLPPYGALGGQLQQHAATIGLQQPPHLGERGVTPAQIHLPEDAPATTRFEDALPGSQIAVYGPDFEYGEQCTVLEMKPEWGPTSIPAVYVSDSNGARRIIPASGRWKIQILVSAKQLGIEQIPDGAIRARIKPLDVIALQWKGGAGPASTIILWAAGHAVVRFVDEEEDGNERLVIQKLNSPSEEHARPGDYIVKSPEGDFFVVLQGDFPERYDEVNNYA